MASYLLHCVYLDVLWCHEENDAQCTGVYLGHRDGEDQQPGEQTSQAVDHNQDGVAQ